MASDNRLSSSSSTEFDQTWPLECPFSEVGCSTLLYTNGAYHDHLSENTEQHLQMVMDLHHRSISGTTTSSGGGKSGVGVPHDNLVVSPLEKLEAVKTEVEFLEGTLESSGITQLPALECIKTQLILPDIIIRKLGDHCTFRMPDYTSLRKSGKRWISPTFHVRGGYKMCLVVHPSGIGLGAGSHLSLSLLLLFDDQLEWPISLPSHVGIRVELLIEYEMSGADDDDTNSEVNNGTPKQLEVTWQPKNKPEHNPKATAKHLYAFKRKGSFTERKSKSKADDGKRPARIFPPWCQQPPSIASVATTAAKHDSTTQSSEEKDTCDISHHTHDKSCDIQSEDDESTHGGSSGELSDGGAKKEGEELGGVTLFMSEKFATHDQVGKYVEEYNSLVFQVTLCLV